MHQFTTPRLNERILFAILSLLFIVQGHAQSGTIGILDLTRSGVIPDPYTLGSITRIEMEKTGHYIVLDRQDMKDVLGRNGIDPAICYGRTCAIEIGRILGADKMLIGSVERLGERIAITLKIIDVATGAIDAANTSEYANLQNEIQRMIELSVKRTLGIPVSEKLADQLRSYDQPIASVVGKVNLSGPRMGLYYTDGILGERMRAETHGGSGMYGVTSMIGWQQEVQYFSSGDFQCLLEFLFAGSGLESGRFIPSVTFMNGFRLSEQGWEIALGPTFRAVRSAKGYYELHGENNEFDPVTDWHLESDHFQLADEYASGARKRGPTMMNIDQRGTPHLSAGLVLALGRTFRSGQLNIPVNAYMIPRKNGTVYGISVGFNVSRSSN